VIAAIANSITADETAAAVGSSNSHANLKSLIGVRCATRAAFREAISAIVPGYDKLKDIAQTKEEFQIAGRTFHVPKFATPDAGPCCTRTSFPPLRH